MVGKVNSLINMFIQIPQVQCMIVVVYSIFPENRGAPSTAAPAEPVRVPLPRQVLVLYIRIDPEISSSPILQHIYAIRDQGLKMDNIKKLSKKVRFAK